MSDSICTTNTIIKTKEIYLFHFVGSSMTMKYNVKTNQYQVLHHHSVIREFKTIMSYEQFINGCRDNYLLAIELSSLN